MGWDGALAAAQSMLRACRSRFLSVYVVASDRTFIAAVVVPEATVVTPPGRGATVAVVAPPVAPIVAAGHVGAALGHARSRIAEDPVRARSAVADEDFRAASGNAVDDAGGIGDAAEPVFPRTGHQALGLGLRQRPE